MNEPFVIKKKDSWRQNDVLQEKGMATKEVRRSEPSGWRRTMNGDFWTSSQIRMKYQFTALDGRPFMDEYILVA